MDEWREYCRSGRKPDDIPSAPHQQYKEKGWINYGDWLRTNTVATRNRKFRPFKEAREYAQSLHLPNVREWEKYCSSGKKPDDIPRLPNRVYKDKGWINWGDWIGTYTIADRNRKYRSFVEAREFVRSLNLTNQKEWEIYCKSGKKPDDIPYYPRRSYKNKGWISFGDWLGTNTVATFNRKYRSFVEAREFVRLLNLTNQKEWEIYCKSGKKPDDIPSNPALSYKDKGWINLGDWLGTNTVATFNRKYRSFVEAREFVRSLNLHGVKDWEQYCMSGKKPDEIPRHPERSYKEKGWINYGDWLGTYTIADRNRKFRPFNEAREYANSLNLSNVRVWEQYCNSGKIPANIPWHPDRSYKNKGWINYGDWLGTNFIATRSRRYRSFKEAREYARSLNLSDANEWREYCKSGKISNDIPTAPNEQYKDKGWISWGDWLGTGTLSSRETGWPIEKVKELLRSMIESRVIFDWSEARLYKFLLTKGVLNLNSANKHNNFFKNLINAVRTEEGRKIVEDYAFSQSNDTPDLSNISQEENEDEILVASTEELSKLVNDNFDPLDYNEPPTVEQVLSSSSLLESINVDEEAMKFFLRGAINDLWKRAFNEEEKTVIAVKNKGKNGHKFHDTVIDIFLLEYENTQKLKIPEDYSSYLIPNLMQKYVAYKISSSPYFGNFSGTGAGKTLSAILASRIINSKLAVIVCPNDIVSQWENEIKRAFPNSHITTGKNAFSIRRNESNFQYVILNYDKFNQSDSSNLILKLMKQKIDFVILDEIHYSKVTSEEETSLRNRNLVGLLTGIRKKNPNAKVLGLTATPVVNNLIEGKSLLEMITGKIYEDIKTKANVPNSVTLYEKLSTISIRELPAYNNYLYDKPEFVKVDANLDIESYNKIDLKDILSTEKILTNYRIKEILNYIDKAGYTIIYTEYVGKGIIQALANAIHQNLGLKVAFHTGIDHTGNKLFQEKKAQVLIASRPLSIGIDGLHVCNRLIINSLPWTNARYQQLIGRLIRTGQNYKVNVIIMLASLKFGDKKYEYDRKKWNRIEYKRTLADCAVDGVLPERNLVTPEQAHKEGLRWLERLERGEISTVSRKDLEIELTPAEKRLLTRKYGDITLQHQKMNTEYSYTTHERLQKDPQEWLQYHRQLNEKRKSWSVDPLDVIISRLKTMSSRLKIGDFGCGTAKIMEEIGSDRVISFDHVAINDEVIDCDIKSVSKYVEDNSLDVIVFSLSLMGKNWKDYIIEAKRCLSTRGSLFIGVTKHELDEGRRLHLLPNILKDNGFVIDTIEERGDFTFMEGIKI